MIPCDRCEELINARLDGYLSEEEAPLLDAHLAQCPDCRKLDRDLTSLHQRLSALSFGPPESLTAAVMAQLETETIQAPKKKRPWAAAVCAAAVVLLAVTLSPQLLPFGHHAGDTAAGDAVEAPEAVVMDAEPAEGGEAAAAPEENRAETESQSQNPGSITQNQALERLNNYLEERGISLKLTPGTPPGEGGFWVFLGENPGTGARFQFSVSCTNGSVEETPLP